MLSNLKLRLFRVNLIYFLIFWSLPTVSYAELPVACGVVNCGTAANQFVTSGTATLIQDGLNAIIEQQTDRAILNWQSFNVGRDNKVIFRQPNASSAALNRIFQGAPSQILGTIEANGQVFLINNNGIVFGQGSQVNVGGLTASALDLSDNVFLDLNIATAINEGLPAFSGGAATNAKIEFQEGSSVTVDSGQRILAIAPEVVNSGDLTTPSGQAILAGATDSVYLFLADADSDVRGLLVEVGTGGSVENLGKIIAERGNITLIGQAVRQAGSVSATTSVSENGSIRLLARDGAVLDDPANPSKAEATTTGTLQLAEGSLTQILPDYSSELLAAENQEQKLSKIELAGKTIEFGKDSTTRATGGNIEASAVINPQLETLPQFKTDARIFVDEGSVIDVSGDDTAVVSASQNQASISIRANELADSPAQKDGPLLNQEVQIDVRFGTQIADVSNAITGVERTVAERLSVGGSVNMTTDGDVILKDNAVVDLSGGRVSYTGDNVNTSQLLLGTQIINITDARAEVVYDALLPSLKPTFIPGYIEGKDAGSLSIIANDLVFDGNIVGNVTRGINQRWLPASLNDRPAYTRGFNQAPLSAAVSIDLSSSLNRNARILASNLVTPLAGDFTIDSILANDHIVNINTNLLGNAKINDFTFVTQGALEILDNIVLAENGNIDITAGSIDVDGANITSYSGSVSLNTTNPLSSPDSGAINLVNGSSINTSGLWINDFDPGSISLVPRASRQNTALISINAGDIELNAEGDISISANSVLNASSGAYQNNIRDITNGEAGDILVAARLQGDESAISNVTAGNFVSYGIDRGGKLTLESNSIEINRSGSGVQANTLYIDDNFFSSGGFSEFEFISNRSGLLVDSTARISPRMLNFQLPVNASFIDSGAQLISFSSLQKLPTNLRQAVSLSLESQQSTIIDDTLKGISNLVLESGSSINLDNQARFSAVSDNSLFAYGTVNAPAGDITLAITDPKYNGQELGFLDSQSIWLGSSARLNAAGTFIETPNFLNPALSSFEVLDAGAINFDAARGYVVLEEGSVLDVSGISRRFNQYVGIRLTSVNAYGDAGRIDFNIGEGLFLNSTINATANPLAKKGELQINLQRRLFVNQIDLISSNPDARPPLDTARIIQLSDTDTNVPSLPGESIPDQFNGKAFININDIRSSRLDSVKLLTTGSISFNTDISLALGRNLELDAPLIDVLNNDIALTAPYMSIGPTEFSRQSEPLEIIEGDGELRLQASHLDISGNLSINGADSLLFNINGDVQLKGLFDRQARTEIPSGALVYSGDLNITADQLYASTYTKFDIKNLDMDDGVFDMRRGSNTYGRILSAISELNIDSPFIRNSGVIRAPQGQINLNASQQIDLNSNSLISVSLENSVVPFGRNEASDWVYTTTDGSSSFTTVFSSLPEKSINLNSDTVNYNESSVVDISGGGDLLSYQFVPGPNGTNDILDNSLFPNSYAISRVNNTRYVSYDQENSQGFDLELGTEIVLLDGISGLPAGRYALYPARYAILPNFYLITKQDGFQGITRNQTAQLSDGSTLIGGLIARANTPIIDYQSEGYRIIPSSQLNNFAQYDLTSANNFFSNLGNGQSSAPANGGIASFIASSNLTFLGDLKAGSAFGSGGLIDIQSENIAIVDSIDTIVDDGFLKLLASSLSDIGSDSLLIGGSRSILDTGDINLNVDSQQIKLFDNVELSNAEIILAAIDNIEIGEGASLISNQQQIDNSSSPARVISVSGDSAILRVSSNEQVLVERDGIQGLSGSINVSESAQITTENSITFDVTDELNILGRLAAVDGSIQFSAENLILTNSPITNNEFDATVISTQVFADSTLSELQIVADESIGLKLTSLESVDNLILDTANIYSADSQADKSDNLTLSSLTIRNTGNNSDNLISAVVNSSQLNIVSDRIDFDAGTYNINSYNNLFFTANSSTQFSGDIRFSTDSTNFTIDTPIVEAVTASNVDFQAITTNLSLLNTKSSTATAASLNYGSQYEFIVNSFILDTNVDNRSGEISIDSVGDVTIGGNASINLSGVTLDFINTLESISAGKLNIKSRTGSFSSEQNENAINLSGDALGGDAGVASIEVQNGTTEILGAITANAQDGYRKGQIIVDTNSLENFSTFNQILNQGNVDYKRSIRVRTGDIEVGTNDSIKASNIELSSDAGSINVLDGATLRATSTSDRVSSIKLYADSGIFIEDGAIVDASADSETLSNGGDILFSLTGLDGSIVVGSGSTVTADGSDGFSDGDFIANILVDQSIATNNDLADRLSLSQTGNINSYIISPYTKTTLVNNLISQSNIDNAFTNLTAYVDRNKTAFENNFSPADLRYNLGLEFQASDLETSSDINLLGLRYSDQPINLTLRSAEDIDINHIIADGFDTNRVLLAEDSSTIKLIAGTDLSSSRLNAVNGLTIGDININQDVYTGTGDIKLYSAADINLNANIYTAGQNAGIGTIDPTLSFVLAGSQFGRNGGDITVSAKGNFTTEAKNQLITQWLFKYGEDDLGNFIEYPTIWSVNYDLFDQGIGALGGGNVNLDIDGNATGLNVSIPTVAIHQGDFSLQDSRLTYTDDTFEIIGGGSVTASVGGNLMNATVYVESGSIDLSVNGGIGSIGQAGQGLLIGLGDTNVNIVSSDSVYLDGFINPFLLPLSQSQDLQPILNVPTLSETYFATYTDNTSIAVTSNAGDVFYESNSDEEFFTNGLFINTAGGEVSTAFEYLPGSIALKALGGDLVFSDDLVVGSSPTGNLDLIAFGNIRNDNESTFVGMSDLSPLVQPSVTNRYLAISQLNQVLDVGGSGADFHAVIPVHINDTETSKITALNGNIEAQGGVLRIVTAEATDIYAGNDLTSINLFIQNINQNDISSIQLGGSLVFPNVRRSTDGALTQDNSSIVVNGPGVLQVIAGSEINLGGSAGITSIGNLSNPFLSDNGADILLMPGVALERSFLQSVTSNDFITLIDNFRSGTLDDQLRQLGVQGIADGNRPSFSANGNFTSYQREQSAVLVNELELNIQNKILAFAEQLTGTELTLREATQIYDQADQQTKRLINNDIIFEFLRGSIELATIPTLPPSDERSQADLLPENWDLGFAIIEQFFPQSGLTQGDLTLFNSTVQSFAGGDINILVPGGSIDAGLPSVVEGARSTDDIGIITQSGGAINILSRGNVAVNSSRIFAIGGGDVTIWSSLGNVDAGRGAQDSLTVPPPTTSIDENGNVQVEFSAAISGSGIGTFTTGPNDPNGSAFFGIPNGFLDAGAAGIRIAGDATFGAQEIRGTEAISIGGDSVAPGLGDSGPPIALTTQADSSSAGASDSATEEAAAAANEQTDQSLGASALKWLEVFILGFGDEETASYESNECLKEDADQVCKG